MRAIGITRLGGVDELKELNIDPPVLETEWHIIVKIKAVSVNNIDTKIRGRAIPDDAPEEKRRPPRNPLILGFDSAGVVTEVGTAVRRFKVGDRVWYAGLAGQPGSNAEMQVVDSRIVGRMPENLSFVQAASMPLVTLAAWEGLFHTMRIPLTQNDAREIIPAALSSNRKRILVIGGAGGMGSIVVQLAKLAGLEVIASASRPDSEAFARSLGADHVIEHLRTSYDSPVPADFFRKELEKIGIEGGVEYIYDTQTELDLKSGYFEAGLEILKPFGNVIMINPTKGPVDLSKMFRKCQSFSFEFIFGRALHGYEPEKQGEILDLAASLVERGILKVPILDEGKVMQYNLENLRRAHTQLETLTTVGKMVLDYAANL
ncbi:zinc-binding alcohol dehydrogenase family protein [Cladochytrium replicatum]|nr:zinc-binding alcohol dehydrogenase family protein [Cladochytrium replicatum]